MVDEGSLPREPVEQDLGAVQVAWSQMLWRVILDWLPHDFPLHVIPSPGSRSTPLLLGLFNEKELVTDRLFIDPVRDERSAGFAALGSGRSTGWPAVLVCTSGTAAAHYYPAVIEASEAHIPLIVISADRPAHLVGTGANQTIDQQQLFGKHVRCFTNLARASLLRQDIDAHADGIRNALDLTVTPLPGPIHFNAPFDKPLQPDDFQSIHVPNVKLGREYATRRADRSEEASDVLVETLSSAQRPVILAGPDLPRSGSLASVHTASLPIIADTTSNLRFSSPFDSLVPWAEWLLAAGFADEHQPDAVLHLGRVPAGQATNKAFANVEDASWWWSGPFDALRLDPFGTSPSYVTHDQLLATLQQVRTSFSSWCERWAAANELVEDALLAFERDLPFSITELGLLRGVARGIERSVAEEPCQVLLGNSQVVRDWDLFVPPWQSAIPVQHQRGVSGIDGLLAGAAGAALRTGMNTVVVLGDISFLHDVGSLALIAEREICVTIVVINNAGGRIFEQLPLARHVNANPGFKSNWSSAWLTDHRWDLAKIARTFGIPAFSPNSAQEAENATYESLLESQPCLIQLAIHPVDSREARQEIQQSVQSSLRSNSLLT